VSQIEEFAEQLKELVTDGQFSEEAVLSVDGYPTFSVTGIFFSGSYEEGSMAAYSTRNLVDKEFFQISVFQLIDIPNPWNALRGATLEVRNKVFRVLAISGKRGDVLTLELQEAEEDAE
jgi:hypothetical protein